MRYKAGAWGVIALLLGGVLSPVSSAAERKLVQILAPEHDPLFVDAVTIKRSGPVVSFNYVLNVLAAAEGRSVPGSWKSNEVAAAVDCSRNTFKTYKLIAYSGPNATGYVAGTAELSAAERKPERIVPKSTTAYLAAYVCGSTK